MNHFANNGKEYLKKKTRQYRSRQGKSDKQYSSTMRVTLFVYICIILSLFTLLIINTI